MEPAPSPKRPIWLVAGIIVLALLALAAALAIRNTEQTGKTESSAYPVIGLRTVTFHYGYISGFAEVYWEMAYDSRADFSSAVSLNLVVDHQYGEDHRLPVDFYHSDEGSCEPVLPPGRHFGEPVTAMRCMHGQSGTKDYRFVTGKTRITVEELVSDEWKTVSIVENDLDGVTLYPDPGHPSYLPSYAAIDGQVWRVRVTGAKSDFENKVGPVDHRTEEVITELPVPGADPETFEVVYWHMTKDKDHVWWYWPGVEGDYGVFPVEGADAATFETVLFEGKPTEYFKDKNRVYFARNPIEGADPATFVVDALGKPTDSIMDTPPLAHDKNHKYEGDNIVE